MTINALMRALIAEMEDGDVPAPLRQPLTLALVWADLARLAGEDAPAEVIAVVDGPAIVAVQADTVRRWMPRRAVAG